MELSTKCGNIIGNEREHSFEYLGIKYANAPRFEYAQMISSWEGVYDATKEKITPAQKRAWPEFEHLEKPERAFYHKEYREGHAFNYGEEELGLNIYTPKKEGKYPVIVFIHGGGFDSGSIYETSFDGDALASRDLVVVFVSYRVSMLGYLSHKEIEDKYGRDGNFGLDDQLTAIKWVKENISSFYGDDENITLMGQSAGAISIQYLCLNKDNEGLFRRAIMMSGGGAFPKFALPRTSEKTHEYWEGYLKALGASSLEEAKSLPLRDLFAAYEEYKATRKDNMYNTMPMVDFHLLKKPVHEAIKEPLHIDYMLSYTNDDMFAPILAHMALKFSKDNKGYCYYFDKDAPGDNNHAFHSSDLRYVFGTLDKSWRPYNEEDIKLSNLLMDYIANFARSGNPNGENLPQWDISKGTALRIGSKIGKCRPNYLKLAVRMLQGDPK